MPNNIVPINRVIVTRTEILLALVKVHSLTLAEALNIVRKYEDAQRLRLLARLLFD